MTEKKRSSDLFNLHEHALEREYDVCPECGSELQLKHSKKGSFLGCSNYPNCQYIRALHEQPKVEDKILEGSECPKCGNELAVKQGRYGLFIGCSQYPQCDYIEEQQHDEQQQLVACPKCRHGELTKRNSRYGKTFYGCDNYPKCRYVVNFEPIATSCPQCNWPIMVKRQLAQGAFLVCPEKKCGYKQKQV